MGYCWIIRDTSGAGRIARQGPDASRFMGSYVIVVVLYLSCSEGCKRGIDYLAPICGFPPTNSHKAIPRNLRSTEYVGGNGNNFE